MEHNRPCWWKRNYLSNPKFQLQVIGGFLAVYTVTLGIVYWGVYHSLYSSEASCSNASGVTASTCQDFIVYQLFLVRNIILTNWVLGVVFLAFASLILTHRIAGPLFRLKNELERAIESGTELNLTFRKKDHFSELAKAISDYSNRLNKNKSQ
jgi:hypothetical protein